MWFQHKRSTEGQAWYERDITTRFTEIGTHLNAFGFQCSLKTISKDIPSNCRPNYGLPSIQFQSIPPLVTCLRFKCFQPRFSGVNLYDGSDHNLDPQSRNLEPLRYCSNYNNSQYLLKDITVMHSGHGSRASPAVITKQLFI